MKFLVRLIQFLFAATFIVSGISKCVDPAGTSIKFVEYLQYFGLSSVTALATPMAWLLSLIEFYCGINLLFGLRRKITLLLSAVLMLVFTPLTAWLATTNAIDDCGCFGDLIHLSNQATFVKNLVLDTMLVVLILFRQHTYALVGRNLFKLFKRCDIIGACLLCWAGSAHEPVIDFRPFRPGTNLRASVLGDSTTAADSVWYTCIYERDGQRQEFDIENLPDEEEGWEFVDTIEHTSQPSDDVASAVSHIDFFVRDEAGDIFTDSLLTLPGHTLLLLSAALDDASQHDIDRIEMLHEYCSDNGYAFYCVTQRDMQQLQNWRYNTGAEYPFLFTDVTIIQTICRSNPCLMHLADGVIQSKRPLADLDAIAITSAKLDEQTIDLSTQNGPLRPFFLILILLFAPFVVYLLVKIPQIILKLSTQKKSKMRKKIVAGNWKMNTTLQEGVALAEGLKEALAGKTVNCDVVVCTPFISVASVAKAVEGSVIGVGAEDCSAHDKGAYTGEVAANMIASTGAKYVILGHSERRQYHGENNELLVAKLQQALANGLTPIFCVGEVKEERLNNTYLEVIEGQMEAMYTLSAEDFAKCVVAYEPVWAIGTGLTASSEQAQEVHAAIRASIAKKYNAEVADNCSILYGGSCKGSNAPELFAQPDIDGGLIGGAALKVDTFMPIIEAWK